jgi:hypothetical protein
VSKEIQKLNECVYCGQTENLTKDHIPPKNLFAKPRPNNLITVPSCYSCNKGFQLDDDYFWMIMHTRMETGGHAELNKTKAKFITSLNRKESARYKRAILNSLFSTELVTKSGLYVGRATAFRVKGKRLNRVASRIVKGLFYHEKGFRLPDDCEALAFADPLTMNDDPEVINRMVSFMLTKPEKVIGDNVFSYRYYFHEEEEYTSAWLMVFYESMLFFGSTSLKE